MNLSLMGILMAIPGVIITVTLHEYTKSLVAYKLGDTGVKTQGRLAPNPLKQMDILGSIFLVVFAYGWASPVRLVPHSFKDRKQAMMLIFVMPFLVNFIVGAIFAIGAGIFSRNAMHLADMLDMQTLITIATILRLTAIYNISFALFSLIPIHPLNGTHLLWAIKPTWAVKMTQYDGFLKLGLAFFIILGGAAWVFHPIAFGVLRALGL